MSQEEKPREFWIPWHLSGQIDNAVKLYSHVLCKSDCDMHKDHTHVIEYSAYSQMRERAERAELALSYLPKVPTEPYEKEMAKKIIELESRIAKLRWALIYYTDGETHGSVLSEVAVEALANDDKSSKS